MSRLTPPWLVALSACGGLTPLGLYTDTSDTADVDTSDTGDVDTSDTGTDVVINGSAPVLQNISAADLGAQVSVSFTATDADNDLNGGTFELTVNGGTTAYDIPGSLATWDGSSGTGTIRFATPSTGGGSGCSGSSATLSIRGLVEDNAGERSGQKSTTLNIGGNGGGGIPTTEVGNGLDNVFDGGTNPVPCTFAGTIDQTGAGNGYADLDIIAFAVTSPGTGLDLTWNSSGSDFDLYLFDSSGFLLLGLFEGDMNFAPPLASGINEGMTPEHLSVALSPGEIYYAMVGGWDGPAGSYSLTIR